MVVKIILLIIIGFCGGVIIAGGVFAFLAIIGVVPRLAIKTGTQKRIKLYEDCLMIGGVFGTLNLPFELSIPLGIPALLVFGLAGGVFVGSVAVSLAEVLDVIPILSRRIHLKRGMAIFMVALALGKMIGALIYFLIPGFVQFK